jgi:DNA-binding winged helix-turn-helix (wHTH) protein
MIPAMKNMKKILLCGLPESLQTSLLEQVALLKGEFSIVIGKSGEIVDLVVMAAGQAPAASPGCPALELNLVKPQRLGPLLRQMDLMLSEPALYLPDIRIGSYILKAQDRILAHPEKTDISLTDREVDILAFLAKQRGAVVSRDDLLKNVWEYQAGVDTHTLETHIYRLRQKIENAADAPEILLTDGGGYRLNPDMLQ